jgi:hypothetical protein
MDHQQRECRFRGSLRMGDREWDWCFLYNGEILKLECERCQLKISNSERPRPEEVVA